MRALDRKLLRDLWKLKGQAVAIALVIGVGVAMFVNYLSVFRSLRLTQEIYYEREDFAEVFADLKRAPRGLEGEISQIPGVSRIDTRVVVNVNLDVPGLDEPAAGLLISVPRHRQPMLNDVVITQGRYPEPDRRNEVLVSEGFALARELGPGDSIAAVINGRRTDLEIVGTALSPEFVYTIRPGDLFPDEGRYGIFWMGRQALSTAYDMEGAFNNVVIDLMPGAQEAEVISRLDRLLERYGGLGAIPRSLQISHWYLESELVSLQTAGLIIPMIFLGVAAFLLNVALTRIVAVQREQIAALKALGYSDGEIARHYAGWSLAVSAGGAVAGIFLGAWMGSGMIRMYNDFFRFPILTYELAPSVVVGAVVVSLVAAIVGALGAVRRAVALPPAEAMRPEPPASYRQSLVERMGLGRFLPQAARMVVRNLERRPGRAAISILGIGFSGALLIVGLFSLDSIDLLLDLQFNVSQRQDVTVSFVEPASRAALFELAHLPGVLSAEPLRSVPVRLRFGHRERQLSITGIETDPRLYRVVDASFEVVNLPPGGLVLSTKLAEILGVEPGDEVVLEVLEGRRPVRRVVVTRLVEEYLGTSAYMNAEALHQLMREAGSLSGAALEIDPDQAGVLYSRLKGLPKVVGVALKGASIQSFEENFADTLGVMIFFNVLFASVIAFGVVYNAARISLSERGHELATLRVMGFTRAEISAILLGELAVITAIAIPLGLLIGWGLASLVSLAFDSELYRLPVVISRKTLSISVATVAVSALVSGLIVRRKLDRLDLVAVLKTRE